MFMLNVLCACIQIKHNKSIKSITSNIQIQCNQCFARCWLAILFLFILLSVTQMLHMINQTINRCKQTSTTNKPNQSHQTNKFNVINEAITSIIQCMCMCIVCGMCVLHVWCACACACAHHAIVHVCMHVCMCVACARVGMFTYVFHSLPVHTCVTHVKRPDMLTVDKVCAQNNKPSER